MTKNPMNGIAAKIIAAALLTVVVAGTGKLWNHEGRLVAQETALTFIKDGIEQINAKLDRMAP